jgi:hypothetical protein
VQVTAAQTVLDRAPTEAERHQLPDRDHAMLPVTQLGDLPVTWALFARYVEVGRAQVHHVTDGRGSLVTGQHLL